MSPRPLWPPLCKRQQRFLIPDSDDVRRHDCMPSRRVMDSAFLLRDYVEVFQGELDGGSVPSRRRFPHRACQRHHSRPWNPAPTKTCNSPSSISKTTSPSPTLPHATYKPTALSACRAEDVGRQASGLKQAASIAHSSLADADAVRVRLVLLDELRGDTLPSPRMHMCRCNGCSA